MEKSVLIHVLWIAILIIILVRSYRKKKIENADYFGHKRKWTKAEQKKLHYYQRLYVSPPLDKRFPNLRRDKFELEDIALTATQMIFIEELPSKEEIVALKPGDLVKLWFRDRDGDVERMWVEVVENQDIIFRGKLRNDPVSANLLHGRELYFHGNHISDIDRKAG